MSGIYLQCNPEKPFIVSKTVFWALSFSAEMPTHARVDIMTRSKSNCYSITRLQFHVIFQVLSMFRVIQVNPSNKGKGWNRET